MTDDIAALREIFRNMDGDRAREIRDAFYKAYEGLEALAIALEQADAQLPRTEDQPLLEEHLIAAEALTTLWESNLGRVL